MKCCDLFPNHLNNLIKPPVATSATFLTQFAENFATEYGTTNAAAVVCL